MDPTRAQVLSRGHRRGRLLGLVGATVGACAALVAFTTLPANALVSSTTVTPGGHNFSASLSAGATADFVVDTTTVSCHVSSTSGTVPAAPGNHNNAGPVHSSITPAVFEDPGPCPTTVPLTTATSTSSGAWSIDLQFDPAGSTGTLNIPQHGVHTVLSGLVNCDVDIAPSGPITVTGSLVPASGGAPPKLVISGATIPINVGSGFGCPTATHEATFTASYDIIDTTDGTQTINITA